MIKVKICGITNREDAFAAVNAGCDALGFLFYRNSPRYISPHNAGEIIRDLPKNIVKIGVFVNAKERRVKEIAKQLRLDFLQFHGSESAGYCDKFKGYKTIKTFRIKDTVDEGEISRYHTFAYLFDTFSRSKLGGTGKIFDWKLVRHISHLPQPIFLSGGLHSGNVEKAIRVLHPAWVDVCSGVESVPGKKDHNRVREFIRLAKGTRI